MLESKHQAFTAKDVGLVLIASPSYGSTHADTLDLILRVYNHHAGMQLQWGNWSLRDLDDRFRDLVHRKTIPSLRGVELYENHCIVPGFLFPLRYWWVPFRTRRVIVTKESAGRYFGAPKLMRNTDHFSIVKPNTKDYPTHQALVDFVTDNGFVAGKKANPS